MSDWDALAVGIIVFAILCAIMWRILDRADDRRERRWHANNARMFDYEVAKLEHRAQDRQET